MSKKTIVKRMEPSGEPKADMDSMKKKKVTVSPIEINSIREAFEPFKNAVDALPNSSFKNRFTASIKNTEKTLTAREKFSERRALAKAILNGSVPLSAVQQCMSAIEKETPKEMLQE